MTGFADPVDLLVPLLAAVIHPLTGVVAVVGSFFARSRWTVRGSTAGAAGLLGLFDALDTAGILYGVFVVASAALGGLLVAEAVLVVLAPVLALLFGLAAVILARFKTMR
jgi:hypothetical protein